MLAVLLLGAALRLTGLLTLPYEQDELYTLHESTYLFHSQLHPGIEGRPLYFLLQHVILAIAPPSPWSLRILPWLCGCVGLWITWLLGRHYFGESAGLIALLLATLSPWHLYASSFARYYALLYALAGAVFLLLPRSYERDTPGAYFGVLALLLTGSATHPSFVFPIIGVVVAVTVVNADGRVGWRWPSRRAWLCLWGPLIVALGAAYTVLRLTSHEAAFQNFGGRGTLATLRLVPTVVQWMTPTVFLAGAVGAGVMAIGPEPRFRRWGWMALLGVGTTLAILVFASTKTNVYADYATAMLPLVFVSAGGVVQWAADSLTTARTGFTAVAVGMLLLGVLPSTVSHLSDGTRFDYRPAFGTIGQEGPTLAVLTQPIVLQRAYAPGLRAYQLRPGTTFLDSTLARERDLWVVTSAQRYGIVGDPRGTLRDWLAAHCILRSSYARPRFDYRSYRVGLYRCTEKE